MHKKRSMLFNYLRRVTDLTFVALLTFVMLGQRVSALGISEDRKNDIIRPVDIAGCPMFPENNIWNTRVDTLPVHARSSQWINSIGRDTGFHMDFGEGEWDGGPIGIPYNIVNNSVPGVSVDFYYDDESDPGPYPIPNDPEIEHGGDHHILIVNTDTCILYEIYDASESGGDWDGGSGAIRFTADETAGYIWPARHQTSDPENGTPPMGARFRLKASFNITGYPAEMQVILLAMKRYGIILADNGSDWYVSGAPHEDWDDEILHLLDDVTGDDFEAVDTSDLMVDYNSGAAQTRKIISGNAGIGGAALSYTDGVPMSVIAASNGNYSLTVSDGWSGTITPSRAGYTFVPANMSYINVTADISGEDYSVLLPAPMPTAPRQNFITNDTTPSFNWLNVANAGYYEIEIASNVAFTSMIDAQNNITTLPFSPDSSIGDGKYYWRVRAFNTADVPSPWSLPRSFTVDASGPVAPVNTSPSNIVSVRRTPTFRWTRPATAVYYEFRYDNNIDFSSPIYVAGSANPSRKPPKMTVGTYSWQVRARDAAGNWSAWSTAFTVTIQ